MRMGKDYFEEIFGQRDFDLEILFLFLRITVGKFEFFGK